MTDSNEPINTTPPPEYLVPPDVPTERTMRIRPVDGPLRLHNLTIIGPAFGRRRKVVYQCDCGTIKVAALADIRRGFVKSCGCVKGIHKGYKHPDYVIWKGIRARCTYHKEHNKYYALRGIKICDRWADPVQGFWNFLADMGPRPSDEHSIDRIDPNGDYCPENCRWATRVEQAQNRRSNRYITYKGQSVTFAEAADDMGLSRAAFSDRVQKDGVDDLDRLLRPRHEAKQLTLGDKTMTIAEWADHLGLSSTTIYKRLKKGWPVWRALQPDMRKLENVRNADHYFQTPPSREPGSGVVGPEGQSVDSAD